MSQIDKNTILQDVLELLHRLARDWEYSGDIDSRTYLFADLGFESIDAVVLSSFIQEHYQRKFPFPQLLADIGQREIKDMRIGELVDFVHTHMETAVSTAGP